MDQPRRSRIVWIEFAIGVAAVGLGLIVYATTPALFSEPNLQESPLLLAGLVGLAVGFLGMIRVIRGPSHRRTTSRRRDR